MSSSTTAAYPPSAARLRPGRGHHDGRAVVDDVEHPVPRRASHRHAGERAAQLLGGAPVAEDGRPEAAATAGRAGRGRARRHRTSGRSGGGAVGSAVQRPGADRAAGRLAAGVADQRGGVARRAASARAPAPAQGLADRCVRAAAGAAPHRARVTLELAVGRAGDATAGRSRDQVARERPHGSAQPVATSAAASTLRAYPPTRTRAHRCSWARRSSTSRVWGYGARGSA